MRRRCGEYSADGFWYYFPVVFALKTPTPLIVLILIGPGLLAVQRRQLGVENALFVALPIATYTTFAVASGSAICCRSTRSCC